MCKSKLQKRLFFDKMLPSGDKAATWLPQCGENCTAVALSPFLGGGLLLN